MFLIGVAFFVDWLLIKLFELPLDKATLVTAVIFLIAGLVVGERPWVRHQ
jgi:hypothetical protein